MVAVPDLTTDLFLGGTWAAGGAGAFASINPVTGEPLAQVAAASAEDVDSAVRTATAALHGPWAAVPPSQKGLLLHHLADLVERDAETLATLESLEVGTPVGFTSALFVPNLVASLRYYAGWADKINGEAMPNDGYFGMPTHAYTRREPVGVVAAIVPWNAPLMIVGWKLAPALATGNVVIIKPAEDASLAILHLGRLIQEAGFPAGTVQILPGVGAVTGEALAVALGNGAGAPGAFAVVGLVFTLFAVGLTADAPGVTWHRGKFGDTGESIDVLKGIQQRVTPTDIVFTTAPGSIRPTRPPAPRRC